MIDGEWHLEDHGHLPAKWQEQIFSSRQLIIINLIQDHSPKVSEQEIPCSVK